MSNYKYVIYDFKLLRIYDCTYNNTLFVVVNYIEVDYNH